MGRTYQHGNPWRERIYKPAVGHTQVFQAAHVRYKSSFTKYIKEYDRELYGLLRTIPGIGSLTAIALITELGDINRFCHINHLASFVGLVPRMKQSRESERTGDLILRCNHYLWTMMYHNQWIYHYNHERSHSDKYCFG